LRGLTARAIRLRADLRRVLNVFNNNNNNNNNNTNNDITGVCTVYVHNAGHPALYDMATVYVTVRDINDNAPVFAKSSDGWTLDVPENANMAAIHTVEAYDADTGDNARISYFITGRDVRLLFWAPIFEKS